MVIGEWPEFINLANKIYDDEFDEYKFGDSACHIGHDWYITSETVKSGKKLNLLSWEFSKDIDGVIYTINMTNSSEYSSVGDKWWVVHSQTSNSAGVEQFKADFGFDCYIDEFDSVHQTL
jgi:hypothetical protein